MFHKTSRPDRMVSLLHDLCLVFPQELRTLKAGFHMMADRRSQIAIRSAIVCDHMETTSAIVCDPAIAIAEDKSMFYLKAGFHMIADDRRPYCDLRSAIIWKPVLTKGLFKRFQLLLKHAFNTLLNQMSGAFKHYC